jgi:hypothetical protein
MSSRFRKSYKSLSDDELSFSLQKRTIKNPSDDMLENITLENVPFEERRKEARKPLFLVRYE